MGAQSKATSKQAAASKASTRVRKTDVKGLKAAKRATSMTSEEWKKIKISQKGKWPAPEYMTKSHPEQKGHTSYRDETFELVTRFMQETKIAYRPHAKAPGTKSHVRYEKYMASKTVGESLKNDSWPVDWCWDIERGYIKVLGPLRDEPIDSSELTDESELTEVDKAVMQWYKKELAKKYGLKFSELITEKGAGESLIMRAHRLVAQREATKILSSKRFVTDQDLANILGFWGFARNSNRKNVMQKGQEFVFSDTLGLLRDYCGDIHLTKSTHAYPQVVEIINKWLTDRLPSEAKDFKWTSLNLNKNYAARIHRDGNNFGPSMIAAFGDFEGGKLQYYAHDDGKIDLEELQKKTEGESKKLDLKKGLALFNGNSAHAVEDFSGNRFSIVFFTLGCHGLMKKEDREKLGSMGVLTPKPDEDPYKIISQPLGDKSQKRYTQVPDMPTPARKRVKLPAFIYWDKTALAKGKGKKN